MAAETNRPRGIFVTGTDTGVGKTLVAAALARFLTNRGIEVAVVKPVETGVDDPTGPGPDARLLRWASRWQGRDEHLAPLRLRRPLAPSTAAEKEGRRIDPGELQGTIREVTQKARFTIVEGAGGLMVPLAGGYLTADLVRDCGLPLLTVCRAGLGTINHTLLTLFTARTMEIPLAGFIINAMPEPAGEAEEAAPHTLSALASADLLGVLSEVSGGDEEKIEALAAQIAVLPTLPWLLTALGLPGG